MTATATLPPPITRPTNFEREQTRRRQELRPRFETELLNLADLVCPWVPNKPVDEVLTADSLRNLMRSLIRVNGTLEGELAWLYDRAGTLWAVAVGPHPLIRGWELRWRKIA